MSESIWELITNEVHEITQRLKVPSGWLYSRMLYNDEMKGLKQDMCFVPEPPTCLSCRGHSILVCGNCNSIKPKVTTEHIENKCVVGHPKDHFCPGCYKPEPSTFYDDH